MEATTEAVSPSAGKWKKPTVLDKSTADTGNRPAVSVMCLCIECPLPHPSIHFFPMKLLHLVGSGRRDSWIRYCLTLTGIGHVTVEVSE